MRGRLPETSRKIAPSSVSFADTFPPRGKAGRVFVTAHHPTGPGGFRYRGTGRRVVGPYGGVVAVCHSSGPGGYRPLIRPCGATFPPRGKAGRVFVAARHSSGQGDSRYLGGGRFVNRPYGVIVAASVFSFRRAGPACPALPVGGNAEGFVGCGKARCCP